MKKLLDFLFPFRTRKTSLLALSIQTFTDESHLEQIFRQGRVYEYSYKARYTGKWKPLNHFSFLLSHVLFFIPCSLWSWN